MKKGSEKEIHFTVMKNVFDSPFPVHEQYDLKGSTVGRHVDNDEENPDIAYKDNDFNKQIKVGIKLKAQLLEQIETDTQWLESHGICDYSFLIGFCFTDKVQHILGDTKETKVTTSIFTKDNGGILSQDGRELYFIGIIDTLTTYNLKKMGEYFAKSFYYPSDQLSAIKPQPYRKRFQKYLETVLV